MTVAALYVETGGVYFGLDGVDPWDEARDARLYAGPWPVVAHPPCARWSQLAPLIQHLHAERLGDQYRVGEDDGCFVAALAAVRRFGGVIEHPAGSLAWQRYHLPRPTPGGWTQTFAGDGLVTEVDQAAYGHRARKRTWLYLVGGEPAALDWSEPPVMAQVSSFTQRKVAYRDGTFTEANRVRPAEASRTPLAFRDVLLDMARSASPSLTPPPQKV